MHPRPTIEAFDRYLVTIGLRLEAVVVCGSALALLGVTTRQARDFDILDPRISVAIADAARAFAREQRQLGIDLIDGWINDGPHQLADVLPRGWQQRVQRAFDGRALVLDSLGRADLIKTKLFALCDRGTDLSDCVALAPTAEEIAVAMPWLAEQDTNPDWPAHVRVTLADLQGRLGHGV